MSAIFFSIQEYVYLQRVKVIPLDITTFCFTFDIRMAAEHITAARIRKRLVHHNVLPPLLFD